MVLSTTSGHPSSCLADVGKAGPPSAMNGETPGMQRVKETAVLPQGTNKNKVWQTMVSDGRLP